MGSPDVRDLGNAATVLGEATRWAIRRTFADAREAEVHTGECELLGEMLAGIAVHIGARVAALARLGEVLVSNTVKDLVAGSGPRFEHCRKIGL